MRTNKISINNEEIRSKKINKSSKKMMTRRNKQHISAVNQQQRLISSLKKVKRTEKTRQISKKTSEINEKQEKIR